MSEDKKNEEKEEESKIIEVLKDIKNRLLGLEKEAKENMEKYIDEKVKEE